YSTRVGSGPFPSELDSELGDRIREAGGEFGTTTGRPRRCGWLDLVALRYAIRLNSLTGIAITKLDALTGIDPLGVAVRYLGPDGVSFDEFPYHQSVVHKARAELVELPGWSEPITGARTLGDLPPQQQRRLVEREPHADPERDREARLELLVVREDRRGARAESQHDAGHEVVDMAAAQHNVPERPDAVAPAKGPGHRPHRHEG